MHGHSPSLWFLLGWFVISGAHPLASQVPVQTIRGKVIDQDAEAPLPGATIIISAPGFSTGAITGSDGTFRAEGIPVGRYNVEVRFVGYESRVIPELLLISSRPAILEIRLQESASRIEGVEIRAQIRKDIPINRMAFSSARTFTVEETRRFAGGFDDPGRMAASFAGVAGGSPNDNALSIRGNAPKALLWRLEGVAVPNPNHFAGMLVEGGGILSLVSGQLLNNSDFFTGAFPVEYGNALSGVFDMNLRAGNSEKRGWGMQVGTLGLDIFGEGPFVKERLASYIFNYRYSTTALFKDLIPEGQLPVFQDLSFKLSFPTRGAGTFSVWGVGGIDLNGSDPETDSTRWESEWDRMKYEWSGEIGILGVKHRHILKGHTAIHTSLTASVNQFSDSRRIYQPDGRYLDYEDAESLTSMMSLSSVLTHKYGKKLSQRTGVVLSRISYDIDIRAADKPGDPVIAYGSENGATGYMQGFTQWRWAILPALTLSGGVHSMWFFLNNSLTLEPRLGINWKFLSGNSLALAFGNHGQVEPLPAYFYQYTSPGGQVHKPNMDLVPSRSNHFVASYHRLLAEHMRLTAEAYYQRLYNIPVKPGDDYSLVNYKQEYLITDSLTNEGTGTNRGIDLTVERFLHRNWYFLVTASWIDSRYSTGGDRTYSTRWDYGYVLNLLGGREFFLGRNRNKILGINARIVFQGGERIHPVDQEASVAAQEVVYDMTRPWESRYPDTYFIDFTATLRVNKKRYASIWGVQIKNLLLENSVFHHQFNTRKQVVEVTGEGFIFPNISYKIEF